MSRRATILYRAKAPEVALDVAAAAFRRVAGSATGDALAMVGSESALGVVSIELLESNLTRGVFEAECWSANAAMRWVATSSTWPLSGRATIVSEVAFEGAVDWPSEAIECSAVASRYACWGDVMEVAVDRLTVGDRARRFDILGSSLVAKTGDRLSLETVEYVRSGRWGNQAVFEERATGLVIDGGRG